MWWKALGLIGLCWLLDSFGHRNVAGAVLVGGFVWLIIDYFEGRLAAAEGSVRLLREQAAELSKRCADSEREHQHLLKQQDDMAARLDDIEFNKLPEVEHTLRNEIAEAA